MSLEINACDICGKIPVLHRSYSRYHISHKCCDISIGWDNKIKVIKEWNMNNPQQPKVANCHIWEAGKQCEYVANWVCVDQCCAIPRITN